MKGLYIIQFGKKGFKNFLTNCGLTEESFEQILNVSLKDIDISNLYWQVDWTNDQEAVGDTELIKVADGYYNELFRIEQLPAYKSAQRGIYYIDVDVFNEKFEME